MFWKRVASGSVLVVLAILVVLKGGLWIFFALVSFIVILGAIELYRIAGLNAGVFSKTINIFIAWLICLSSFKQEWLNVNLILCLAVGLPFLMEIARRKPSLALSNTSSALLGIMYTGWLFGRHMILLRQMPDGQNLIFLLLGITWTGDTGAYLIGKQFGKHKVIPSVSPGKSFEGYIGGIVLSCAAAFLIRHWLLPDINLLHVVSLGIGLTIVGQIGDLAVSLLKRGANVKDSGNLIPGHGGILDRFDSMVFITPALYYYSVLLIY